MAPEYYDFADDILYGNDRLEGSDEGLWSSESSQVASDSATYGNDSDTNTKSPVWDFSWKNAWPVPLYGAAYFAHRRLRVQYPRKLPFLTPVKLPEVYATFALAHVAHLEATRLAKAMEEEGGTMTIIENASTILKLLYQMGPPQLSKVFADSPKLDFTVGLLSKTKNADSLTMHLWGLRRSWSDDPMRSLVSRSLIDAWVQNRASRHDIGLLTTYVAENLTMGKSFYYPQFLHDKTLMLEATGWNAYGMAIRLGWLSSPSFGMFHTVGIMQRYFFYLLAFRWLAGRYWHYASIWNLDCRLSSALVTTDALKYFVSICLPSQPSGDPVVSS